MVQVARGDLVLDAIVRGDMIASLSDIASMQDGEFFRNTLIVGRFIPAALANVATAEVKM